MIRCAFDIAHSLEKNATPQSEPSYHNRLHFAQTLLCLTALLERWAEHTHLKHESAAAMLLAMTGHDYQHPGGRNTKPMEIERATAKALQTFWVKHAIDPRWRKRINAWIWATDPARVATNIQRARLQPMRRVGDANCTLLITEADIWCSCLPRYGAALGVMLSQELKRKGDPLHACVASDSGRTFFLKHARFHSLPSRQLKIRKIIQQQLAG